MIVNLLLLEEIKKCAENFFSIKETAKYLAVDFDDFMEEMENEDSEVYNAYHKALLAKEFEIRSGIIEMAIAGSPAAQVEAAKLLEKTKINNSL